jgi:hypothetical protein
MPEFGSKIVVLEIKVLKKQRVGFAQFSGNKNK